MRGWSTEPLTDLVTTTLQGATPLTARALGPDLARGFMLLFIALANSHYFLPGDSVLGGYPQDGSAVDSAAAWLISTFVDGRAFPMFGLLFGYGVAHIVAPAAGRRAARGPALLRRRSLVLIAVGVLDGFLFYAGDILAMYGVLLFFGAWAVFWKDRWLLIVAFLFFSLGVAAQRCRRCRSAPRLPTPRAAPRPAHPAHRARGHHPVHRAARPDRLRRPRSSSACGPVGAGCWSSRSATAPCSRSSPPIGIGAAVAGRPAGGAGGSRVPRPAGHSRRSS